MDFHLALNTKFLANFMKVFTHKADLCLNPNERYRIKLYNQNVNVDF